MKKQMLLLVALMGAMPAVYSAEGAGQGPDTMFAFRQASYHPAFRFFGPAALLSLAGVGGAIGFGVKLHKTRKALAQAEKKLEQDSKNQKLQAKVAQLRRIRNKYAALVGLSTVGMLGIPGFQFYFKRQVESHPAEALAAFASEFNSPHLQASAGPGDLPYLHQMAQMKKRSWLGRFFNPLPLERYSDDNSAIKEAWQNMQIAEQE